MAPSRPTGASARAFTLVELLVVISIIALLISILLPSLRTAREQAKMTKCVAHMRGVGQSAAVFAGEHNDHFQVATDEVGLKAADPGRQKYAYGAGGELLSWPVAVAMGAGLGMANNWDWGVRANGYQAALDKDDLISEELELVICPSDKVKVATPYYPRNKSLTSGGVNNDGLRFSQGDPEDPVGSSSDMSYWGKLSYGISEDIAGVEVAESRGQPACWRTANSGSGWQQCHGEFAYPPFHPCGKSGSGWRLRGNFDKVYGPADVGFVFEAGRDDVSQPEAGFANLIISAGASVNGPFLGDFQQGHSLRMPRKRHPKGRMNVLYADMHGGGIRPVKFDSAGVATEYSPRTRVSPYQPHQVD